MTKQEKLCQFGSVKAQNDINLAQAMPRIKAAIAVKSSAKATANLIRHHF